MNSTHCESRAIRTELFTTPISSEPIPAAEIDEMIWLEPGLARAFNLAPLRLESVLPVRKALRQAP
ncbi:hypothetical protein LGH82_07095 [Mesorhizobium sp. PAMC28654]|uniref:hypothetical protein n=1 Tax=Mesorhizobium sp. PAMC28654 TaxID=2880934 RepID=UPI001D0A803D|nr:hypothetical protein [Mesorhizobium sp. PAMC28654]UDL91037.1 hypothetical protein LGH82_07095 [Mesorhizobium sp. PAMC28654]